MMNIKQVLRVIHSGLFAFLIGCIGDKTPDVWNGSADTDWYSESKNRFTINTAEQLAGLAKLVNGGNDFSGKTIRLGANIMLNDTENWQSWASSPPANNWIPIGSGRRNGKGMSFNGTFNGNRHVVSGVYISNSGNNQGLFGFVNYDGDIKNIGVVASCIKGGYNVGLLAGVVEGKVSNSYSNGVVEGLGDKVDELVGEANNRVKIKDCCSHYLLNNGIADFFLEYELHIFTSIPFVVFIIILIMFKSNKLLIGLIIAGVAFCALSYFYFEDWTVCTTLLIVFEILFLTIIGMVKIMRWAINCLKDRSFP